jgi:hypothetical protein
VHVSKQKGIAPTLAWGSKMADSNMRITWLGKLASSQLLHCCAGPTPGQGFLARRQIPRDGGDKTLEIGDQQWTERGEWRHCRENCKEAREDKIIFALTNSCGVWRLLGERQTERDSDSDSNVY